RVDHGERLGGLVRALGALVLLAGGGLPRLLPLGPLARLLLPHRRAGEGEKRARQRQLHCFHSVPPEGLPALGRATSRLRSVLQRRLASEWGARAGKGTISRSCSRRRTVARKRAIG